MKASLVPLITPRALFALTSAQRMPHILLPTLKGDVLPIPSANLLAHPAAFVEDPYTIVVPPLSPAVLIPDETIMTLLFPDALELATILISLPAKLPAWDM